MKAEYKNTIGEIAALCNGELIYGDSTQTVENITTDSRVSDKQALFIPLVGERFDGHNFIEELARNGLMAAFLTEKETHEYIGKQYAIPVIKCENTLYALGRIAEDYRGKLNPVVIGVTGTNGKTTTKEISHALLSKKYTALKNEKNYNNEIGVPFTLFGLKPEHEVAVIEMGMNHSGEIHRLSRIVRPGIAIITNVGEGHLEFLGSVENVARAKAEIFDYMRPGSVALLNSDTECFELLLKKAREKDISVKTFGIKNKADIQPDEYKLAPDKSILIVNDIRYEIPLYGMHNIYNALIAIALAEEMNIPDEMIQDALAGFRNVDGRSQVIDKGYILIDDTYNSNPLSTRMALESIREIYPDKRKIAVLSDMKELGKTGSYYHQETGKAVTENGFNLLCLWGEMAEEYAAGAEKQGMNPEHIKIFNNKNELSEYLQKKLSGNDVVLIKGSRSMKMEEVVKTLEQGN